MNNYLHQDTLDNCLSKIIDYRGKTPRKLGGDWSNSGYRAISANNVKFDGLHNMDEIRCLSEDLYKKWMKEEINRGDLLLTSEAPAGQAMVWDSDEKIVLSQRLYGLRVNEKIDSWFLKYYIQSTTGQSEITKNNSGSTVFGISAQTFKNIVIRYPDKKYQTLIGRILSSIDKKIELNNKINADLEQLAKTIYDYWFIQFDFPNSSSKQYKSSGGKMVWNQIYKREIPDKWSVGSILDLGEVVGGATPPKEESSNFSSNGIPWITPKDLANNINNKFITHGEVDLSEKGLNCSSLKPIPAGTVLLTSRAPIGYMAISREMVTTNQGFKSIIPNKGFSTEFVYYSIKKSLPTIINYSSGSTFKEVSGSVLKTVPTILPESKVVENFTKLVSPLFCMQSNTELENHKLAKLRDWLLPMLMNGQVKVKEANLNAS